MSEHGVIYAVASNGGLLWYRHDGRNDGSEAWASGAKKIGHGWDGFTMVFTGDSGYHPLLQ